MIREEILEMNAGSLIDTLIAEKVMGINLSLPLGENFVSHEMAMDAGYPEMEGQSMGVEWKFIEPPPFSTDIAAAWQVVMQLSKSAHRQFFQVIVCEKPWVLGAFCARWASGNLQQVAHADTAPLAICRVALLTVMDKI